MENRITLSKRVEGKSRLWVTLLLLCFCSFTWAQVKVTGVVTDPSGEAIIGANIVEKGVPGNGTISDIDGNFTLNVKSNKATVTVSFIGYKDKTVALNGSTNLKVTLEEDSQSLDEVVVVGYGSVKKSNLTTSVSKMTSEAIEGRPVTNLSDALSGQLAGVQTQTSSGIPGEEMQITVRGVSSINGSSNPLIVVDGVITENMSNVNPSDVASIQVLKDAAATSIYGARGSAGVILIETKQAQKGAPVVKWESYLGFQNAVGLPEMMSPKEWMAYNLYLKNAMWLQKDGNNTLDTPNKDRPSGDRVNPDWLLNPNSDTADWTLRSDLPQTDWVDAILQTAFTHSHQVSVSSKGDRYSIYASAGYLNQEGIVKHTGYERFNFRINASMNINKHIKAGVNFAPTISSQDRGESEGKDKVIMTALTMIPTIGINEGTRSLGFSKFRKDDVNPYERLRQVTDSRNIKNFDVASWVEANIIKGLTFKSMFNYSSENRIDEYFLPLDVQKMSVKSATASSKVISGSRTGWQNTLSYDFTLWKKHQMNVLLGQSIENRSIYTADMKATDFPLDNVPTLNQGATPSQASTLKNIVRTASLFGRLSYNYDDKYLVSASMRRDGSSRFGPSNRWATFPSVSAGWKINSEEFMKDVEFISLLKLRASWGMTGRDNTAAWQWMQVYAQDANRGTVFETGKDSGNRITINKNNSAVNTDVHWDKDYKTNVGIDAQFLNNRLAVTFDYYYEKNREMLMNIKQTVPSTVGTQSAASNIGEMDSWGGELSVTWKDKIGKDFKYRIGINTGWSDNKVLNMDWVTDYLYRQITPGHRTDVGLWGMQCIGMFRSFQDIEEYFTKYNISTYMGLTKDQVRPGMLMYKDVRGAYDPETGTYAGPDGVVDVDNDQVELGHRSSNLYGLTMNLGADWKGLSLIAQIGASWGGYTTLPGAALKPTGNLEYCNMPSFWNPDNMFAYQDVYDGSGNLVVKENREAYYPNLKYTDVNAVASSFWRVSTARVALNRLTLAYTLPKSWLGSIGIKSCRINITGQNLINFYNPYPDNFMNPMSGSYGSYPNLRKWTVGVNLSF